MQDVQLQQGHRIDLPEQEVFPLETPGLVNHEAPVAKARIVENRAAGQFRAGQPHLFQSLPGAENARLRQGLDPDSFRADGEFIGLLLREVRKGGRLLPEAAASQPDFRVLCGGCGPLSHHIGYPSGNQGFRTALRLHGQACKKDKKACKQQFPHKTKIGLIRVKNKGGQPEKAVLPVMHSGRYSIVSLNTDTPTLWRWPMM